MDALFQFFPAHYGIHRVAATLHFSEYRLRERDRSCGVLTPAECHKLHKLTTEIARSSGLVGVEDLHVRGLVRNRCLSLSFSDAALGKLLDLLATKVHQTGGILVKVDRFFPSSQRCHRCHEQRMDLVLADRVFVCHNPVCDYVGDRDENASINILQEALRLVGQS